MMIARQQTAAVQRTGRATASAPGRMPVALPRSVIMRFKEGEEKGRVTRGEVVDKLDFTNQGPGKPMGQLQEEVRSQANGQYQDRSPDLLPVESAFTRQREAWAARVGIVGFVAACFWETVLPDHPGVISQIAKFTGLSPNASLLAIAGLVAWNAFTALRPGSPTYSQENKLDAAQRPPGAPASNASLLSPKSFLGIDSWGFTKKNEIFNGRLAMLGFTAAVIAEVVTGGLGPLAQVANYLNIPADTQYYTSVKGLFDVYAVLAVALAYANGNTGFQPDKENDVY